MGASLLRDIFFNNKEETVMKRWIGVICVATLVIGMMVAPVYAKNCPNVGGTWDITMNIVLYDGTTDSFVSAAPSGFMEITQQQGCFFTGRMVFTDTDGLTLEGGPFTGITTKGGKIIMSTEGGHNSGKILRRNRKMILTISALAPATAKVVANKR